MADLETQDLPACTRESLYRLDQRNSLIKWAIGTVGLTLVTSIASWYFQNREVRLAEVRFAHERKIQELEFEQRYLGDFLEYALVEDIDSRIRFAHYFASVSTNEFLSKKWEGYHADLVASSEDDSARIGGIDALTGRNITRIWIGAEPVGTMSDFHDYHVAQKGWADIGFHYYVTLDGTVNKARPIGKTPAFVKGHNTGSIAIGLACDGWTEVAGTPPEGFRCIPNNKQDISLLKLTGRLPNDYKLGPDIIGKRSDYRPVPDLLGDYIALLQLKVPDYVDTATRPLQPASQQAVALPARGPEESAGIGSNAAQ